MCEKKQHYSTKPPRWEVPVRFLVKTWASALPERNPASGLRNKPAGVKTKSRTENHFQWQAPYDIITAENGPRPIRPATCGACAADAARCACCITSARLRPDPAADAAGEPLCGPLI